MPRSLARASDQRDNYLLITPLCCLPHLKTAQTMGECWECEYPIRVYREMSLLSTVR